MFEEVDMKATDITITIEIIEITIAFERIFRYFCAKKVGDIFVSTIFL